VGYLVGKVTRSAEYLAKSVAVEPGDYFSSCDSQWTLNQVRLLRHQLERLVGRERLTLEVHRLKGRALGVDVIARVNRF